MRVPNRLDLQRVGDDHLPDIGRQHTNHRHRIPGGLDDDLVVFAEAAAEAVQPRRGSC